MWFFERKQYRPVAEGFSGPSDRSDGDTPFGYEHKFSKSSETKSRIIMASLLVLITTNMTLFVILIAGLILPHDDMCRGSHKNDGLNEDAKRLSAYCEYFLLS